MLRPNESTRLVIKNGKFTSVLILTVYSLLAQKYSIRHFHVHFLFSQNCWSRSSRKKLPLTFVEISPRKGKVQSRLLLPAIAQASWIYRCHIVITYLVFVIVCFLSVFEKEKLKGIYLYLRCYKFIFWFVGIFVYYLYSDIHEMRKILVVLHVRSTGQYFFLIKHILNLKHTKQQHLTKNQSNIFYKQKKLTNNQPNIPYKQKSI